MAFYMLTVSGVARVLLAIGLLGPMGIYGADLFGRVERVKDGDTFVLRTHIGELYNIRIAAIDAPELNQPFGLSAKAELSGILANQSLKIIWRKKDRDGRLIGKALLGKTDVGLELIERGQAWHYKEFRRDQSEGDRKIYEAAEKAARQSNRGLWSQSMPTPPWLFRAGRRKSTRGK